MSAISRLSRSNSKSPRNSPSSSPKRKPLHERSNSETNSIAGSASTGPAPIRDDSDPVYTSSPFPRLPSQVLAPKGSSFIFEDKTAGTGGNENSRSGPSFAQRSKVKKPGSPTGKGKQRKSPRSSPRGSLEAVRSRPGSVANRYGRAGVAAVPRDLTRPLDDVRRPQLPRSNSRVRSLVSAYEASSVKSQSPPATPRSPRTRSRGSRASITSRRFEIGSREAEAIVKENAPGLNRPLIPFSPIETQDTPASDPPAHTIDKGNESRTESSEQSSQPQQCSEQRTVSEEPPVSPVSERNDVRPRSSSAPVPPYDAFLAALISTGTSSQHLPLEQPSVTTFRTDSSSLRRAVPQPLRLRRQAARSNLAVTSPSTGDPSNYYEEDELGDNRFSIATSYDEPVTPPAQVRIHPPSSGRWTPGRWDSEMEDEVPELQTSGLRAQRSFRESWYASSTDLRRSESVTSFQSASSTSLPFYHFLNDSKTAWAQAYYRGEGGLRVATPPNVTLIRSLSARSATRTPNSIHSRSASDPTDTPTPDSASYAQEVYIPRIRPFRNQHRDPPRALPPAPAPESDDDDDDVSLAEDRIEPVNKRALPHPLQSNPSGPVPQLPAEASRRSEYDVYNGNENETRHEPQAESQPKPLPQPPSQPQPPDTHIDPINPTGPFPYLSPDRGNDDRISVWRPPSVEPQSLFSTVNRQIFLFCVGFCFPFGKWNNLTSLLQF